MTPHPLEVAFLVAATLAFGASATIFSLKIGDLIRVRRANQNGPMMFVTTDNLRRQGFTMAVSAGMLMASVSSVNNPTAVAPQTLTLLTCLLFVAIVISLEALFIYRRRGKLAQLISGYEGKPGGKRCTDPPAQERA